jgi:trans-aconitate 2-methyltransferase
MLDAPMPTWNPDQYLKFADERARPCRDLAARVLTNPVRRLIDLGCGPGNSTQILAERWPRAQLTGLDSSPDMIASARKSELDCEWIVGDAAAWAASIGEEFDVIFSNAAMQWLPNHATLFPKLLRRAAPGGALAIQMPANFDAPPHRLMREMAALPEWRAKFSPGKVREWHVHDEAFYYEVLAPVADRVDFWVTEYLHVLPDVAGIVEWYKGTGMRPFLEALASDDDRERFTTEYLQRLGQYYKPQSDGRVLFPFRRIFLIAYRGKP